MLSAPLRERFGIFHHLDFYSEAELTRIVLRSAEILGAKVEPGGAGEIARRARGTPRIVNRLLDRKSTRLNSSHTVISYAVFCLKKKKQIMREQYKGTMEPNGY